MKQEQSLRTGSLLLSKASQPPKPAAEFGSALSNLRITRYLVLVLDLIMVHIDAINLNGRHRRKHPGLLDNFYDSPVNCQKTRVHKEVARSSRDPQASAFPKGDCFPAFCDLAILGCFWVGQEPSWWKLNVTFTLQSRTSTMDLAQLENVVRPTTPSILYAFDRRLSNTQPLTFNTL